MKTPTGNPQVAYATVDRRDLEDALIQIKETSLIEGYRCAACDARHYGGELEVVHSRDCRYMRVTNQLMNALGIAAQLRRLPDGGWSACFYDGTERRIGSDMPSEGAPRG